MARRSASLHALSIVLLAGPAYAQPATGSPPAAAPSDSMRTMATREFELYAPTDADLRARGDEIRVAVSQFVIYMGEHPKKMAFLLFRSAADRDRYDYRPLRRRNLPAVAVILPAKPQGNAEPGASAAGKAGAAPDPLSHEAGHQFFAAYLENALALARPSESGGASSAEAPEAPAAAVREAGGHARHDAVPDWLEEAVAALCERPAHQNRRLEYMRSRIDRRIPFAELLTMKQPPEPGASAKSAGVKTGAAKPAGAGGSAASERAAIFRAQSLSLARYIAYREDARFIGTIVEGVIRGRTVGDVLNTSQHLLSAPEALEKQWLEWMESSVGANRARE